MSKSKVWQDAYQAAQEDGQDAANAQVYADQVEWEHEQAEINRVLAKVRAATGGSFAQARAFWIGGDCEGGFAAYARALEADGYNGYQGNGTYVDNREWFERKGITRAEYEILVAASL